MDLKVELAKEEWHESDKPYVARFAYLLDRQEDCGLSALEQDELETINVAMNVNARKFIDSYWEALHEGR